MDHNFLKHDLSTTWTHIVKKIYWTMSQYIDLLSHTWKQTGGVVSLIRKKKQNRKSNKKIISTLNAKVRKHFFFLSWWYKCPTDKLCQNPSNAFPVSWIRQNMHLQSKPRSAYSYPPTMEWSTCWDGFVHLKKSASDG